MNNKVINRQNNSYRYWNLNLISGIIFISVSLWIFVELEAVFNSLIIVFSLVLFISGILGIISAIRYANHFKGWGMLLFTSILDLIVAFKLILNPQISTVGLTFVLGIVFIYHSVRTIIWSIELNKYAAMNWSSTFLGSILGVLLSFNYLWDRTFEWSAFIILTSFALLITGITEIYFSSVIN